jgi:hypothetical protein
MPDSTIVVRWYNHNKAQWSSTHLLGDDIPVDEIRLGGYALACGRTAPEGGDDFEIVVDSAAAFSPSCERCLERLDPDFNIEED